MNRAIWKFPIAIADAQHIAMPRGAHLLCVQDQNGQACIWAKIDADADQALRDIRIYGTGHALDDGGAYVGTFQTHSGHLVWHVFDHGDVI